MTIAEEMTDYLSEPDNAIIQHGNYKASDFNLLLRVLNGTLDNFMIFDNAGGRKFHIWTTTPKNLKEAVKGALKPHIYYYKLRGVEHIVKKLT